MSDMSGVVCGLETVFGFGTVPGWTDLEVLATTAHGVLYLRKDSSEFFLICLSGSLRYFVPFFQERVRIGAHVLEKASLT